MSDDAMDCWNVIVVSQTAITCNTANTLADGTTYALTADCTGDDTTLTLSSGEATVNGNGNTISGAPGGGNGIVILINGGATLNLNNITISDGGEASQPIIQITGGATLVARNVIFRSNAGNSIRVNGANSGAALTNVQFLDNGPADNVNNEGSVLTAWGSPITVTINGATFEGNSGRPQVIMARGAAVVNLIGCVRASGNTNAAGEPALFSAADPGAEVNGGPGGCPSKKKKKATPAPTPTSTPRPAYGASYVALQTDTGMTFEATYGLDSGVHFRQLDGAGIGIQSIIDAGYLEAFDVYGYVEQGVEVCFPQAGRVIFLDARTMPRAIVPLESTIVNGQTCVSINSPGSLVLLPN